MHAGSAGTLQRCRAASVAALEAPKVTSVSCSASLQGGGGQMKRQLHCKRQLHTNRVGVAQKHLRGGSSSGRVLAAHEASGRTMHAKCV